MAANLTDTAETRGWVNPDWDWRFRVSFDAPLREHLFEGADILGRNFEPGYSERFRDLVEIASERLLFLPLLGALEGAEAETSMAFLDVAENAQPSGLPAPLIGLLQERMDRVSLDLNVKARADALLAREAETVWSNPSRTYLEITFGAGFDDLVAFARDQPPRREQPKGSKVKAATVSNLAEGAISELREENHDLPEIELQICEEPGYGEYWPYELRGGADNRDLLRLNVNDYSALSETVVQTLAHELQGHAVFYQRVRELAPKWIDHGALSLVEGWATSEEWQRAENGPPPLGEWFWRVDADSDELMKRLPEQWSAKGLSAARIESLLLEFFQYPAYQLSYVTGGLWFLKRSTVGASGLDFLESEPVGDFLYAW